MACSALALHCHGRFHVFYTILKCLFTSSDFCWKHSCRRHLFLGCYAHLQCINSNRGVHKRHYYGCVTLEIVVRQPHSLVSREFNPDVLNDLAIFPSTMASFDRGAGQWNSGGGVAGYSPALGKESKGFALVQFFGSRVFLPCLLPFPHIDPGNLVELEYVAGDDLFQRSHRLRIELAGCSTLFF